MTGVPVEPASASPSISTTAAHPDAGHVAEAAHRFGIPEAWIWSVMRLESAGDATATSHAGAMGLMQVMPGTYAELRARHELGPDPYDRRDNILAGAAYLREMHDRYGSTGMLAAYNAGPGRWEDYISRGRPLPAETVAYMARLGTMVGGSAAPSPAVLAPPDPFSWRRATLFVAHGERSATSGSGASPVQPEAFAIARPEGGLATQTGSPMTGSVGSADALFAVRRSK